MFTRLRFTICFASDERILLKIVAVPFPQVHQIFQRTFIRLLKDQPIPALFNASHRAWRPTVRAHGLPGIPQGLRRSEPRLHLGSLLRDECTRVHRESRWSTPEGRHSGEMLPQSVLEAEPGSNVFPAGKTELPNFPNYLS